MPSRDLWHWDAFAWDAGRKRAKQPPTVQNFARPITPEKVDSESDDDNMEDDEERPEGGDTTRPTASENEGEGACHTDKDGVVAAEPGVEPSPVASTGAGVGHEDSAKERPGAVHGERGEQHAAADEQMQTRGHEKEDGGGGVTRGVGAGTGAAAAVREEQDEHVAAAGHVGKHQQEDGPQGGDETAPAAGSNEGARRDAEDIGNAMHAVQSFGCRQILEP